MTAGRRRGLVAELECESLLSRADRLVHLLAPVAPEDNRQAIRALAGADGDFAAFATALVAPAVPCRLHRSPDISAHPRAKPMPWPQAASSGAVSEATVCIADPAARPITLDYEHAEAMAALGRAQDARDALNALLFERSRAALAGAMARAAPDALPLRQLGRLRHGRAHRHRLVDQRPLPAQGKGAAAGALCRAAGGDRPGLPRLRRCAPPRRIPPKWRRCSPAISAIPTRCRMRPTG